MILMSCQQKNKVCHYNHLRISVKRIFFFLVLTFSAEPMISCVSENAETEILTAFSLQRGSEEKILSFMFIDNKMYKDWFHKNT